MRLDMPLDGLMGEDVLRSAARLGDVTDMMGGLGKELQCGICMSIFTGAAKLPCCHYFCKYV